MIFLAWSGVLGTLRGICYSSLMEINHDLIWDYQFTPEQMQTDSFMKWYVARVLTRGGAADIHNVGVETIRKFLPEITLPKAIREFWDWYFETHKGIVN